MAILGHIWDPLWEGPLRLNMRFSHVFGPKWPKMAQKGVPNMAQNGRFWAILGPPILGPSKWTRETFGEMAQNGQKWPKRGPKYGPKWPILAHFGTPFGRPFSGQYEVFPRFWGGMAQNGSKRGPKYGPKWPKMADFGSFWPYICPLGGQMAKNGHFWPFWPFLAFLAILGHFSGVLGEIWAPGGQNGQNGPKWPKWPKMAIFSQIGPKWPFLATFGPIFGPFWAKTLVFHHIEPGRPGSQIWPILAKNDPFWAIFGTPSGRPFSGQYEVFPRFWGGMAQNGSKRGPKYGPK